MASSERLMESLANYQNKLITRRERPKSAPYLRLKNIQGTTIGKIWKKKIFQKKILIFFRKKVFFRSHNAEKLIKKFMV